MTAAEWVCWVLQHGCTERLMTVIDTLAKHDRYQASLGIEHAATYVNQMAQQRGLTHVETHHFIADGKQRWWQFHAPLAWTPLQATLQLDATKWCLDHHQHAYALATYSCSAHGEYTLVHTHTSQMSRCIVVIPAADFHNGNWLTVLIQAGAAGFVTDAYARYDPVTSSSYRGRLELPPGCPLFAFSVLPEEIQHLLSAAQQGVSATVDISLDHSASMPVVTACLPADHSTQTREIWLTAHLCHSRAGANDNASGVSALLETATLLMQLLKDGLSPLRYTLRFVWGPEFLGVAALQHTFQHRPPPLAVINLDMVGEDQAQCASPFCIERPPLGVPSPLASLAEAFTAEVFTQTANAGGRWLSMPFHGFSDHALFMNYSTPEQNCPAIQLCHINDRFNHCAADTRDKVSPLELKRTLAIAVPLLMALQHYEPEHLAPPRPSVQSQGGPRGHWPGPLNLRGLIQELPGSLRQSLEGYLAQNKRYLAALHHCALNADGRSWQDIFAATSQELEMPLPHDVKNLFYHVLTNSPWFSMTSPTVQETPYDR